MKILVDINHPAHVHYFKNFIWEMKKKGHEVLITSSEKEITYKLLDNYGFDYIKMGNYGNSILKKLINIPIMDLRMYRIVKNFNPDIFVGAGSIRAAHVSFLLRKKCINFEDTEHSMEQIRLYRPFVDTVCTPSCFKKDLGRKQVRYNGFKEFAYLHPNYFKPNPEVLDELNLSKDDKFIIVRFISWSATHDIGYKGLNLDSKIKLVKEMEKYGKVFITSESKLDKNLKKYKIKVSSEKMHDLLYYTTLYIGEGGTTSTEAAILGTPSILIDSQAKFCGVHNELMNKYGLQLYYDSDKKDDAFKKAIEILENENSKKEWQKKREKLLNDKIDVTKFMVDFIENCPESFYEYQKTKNDAWK
ncbi:conserved hypothetical protein [groundwater metagenome]|uniref:DUF354 domain-containing protein n=1 Tax=groundwater metagenome TaxID=717931 RepID=A0A098EEP1_9ZZZZ